MADSEEDYYWDRGNEGVNRQDAFSQEWKKAEKEKKNAQFVSNLFY